MTLPHDRTDEPQWSETDCPAAERQSHNKCTLESCRPRDAPLSMTPIIAPIEIVTPRKRYPPVAIAFIAELLRGSCRPLGKVFDVVLNRRAAAAWVGPLSTTARTISSRPFGVRRAF